MARSSAIPDNLRACATAFDDHAGATAGRASTLDAALARAAACGAGGGDCGVAVRLLARRQRGQAEAVGRIGEAFRRADASAAGYLAFDAGRTPTARRDFLQPLWGRTATSWEPSWDSLDPIALTPTSERVESFRASTSRGVGAVSVFSERDAYIRVRTFRDGSVEVTVGCDRATGIGVSSSLGLSVTSGGSVSGAFAGAESDALSTEREEMTWRFRRPRDATAFVDGVRAAQRRHWDDNYGRWQSFRDVAGLGRVHAYAPARFWELAFARNPHPASYERSGGSGARAGGSVVAGTGTGTGAGSASASAGGSTGVRWDFRHARTTFITRQRAAADLGETGVGGAQVGVGGSSETTTETTFDARTGRPLAITRAVVRTVRIVPGGPLYTSPGVPVVRPPFTSPGMRAARPPYTSHSATATAEDGGSSRTLSVRRLDLRQGRPTMTRVGGQQSIEPESDRSVGLSISAGAASASGATGDHASTNRTTWGQRTTTPVGAGVAVAAVPLALLSILRPPVLGRTRPATDSTDGESS